MALITDPSFLVHQMRIKYMRIDDRVGERILTFSPTTMSNDYIKTAASVYPEMQYACSPTYSHDGGFLSSGAMGNKCAPLPMGKSRSLAYTERRREVHVVPPPSHARDDDKSGVDSDDEIDIEDEDSAGGKPRGPIARKNSSPVVNTHRKGSAPVLFITAPSKPPGNSQQLSVESLSVNSPAFISPGGLASPQMIMGDSSPPSPTQPLEINPYPLHISADSSVGPTPKTSPEIEPEDTTSEAAKSHPSRDDDVDDLTPFSTPGGADGISTSTSTSTSIPPIPPLPALPNLRLATMGLSATTREALPPTPPTQYDHRDREPSLSNAPAAVPQSAVPQSASRQPAPPASALSPLRSRSTPTSQLPSSSPFPVPTSRPHAASSPAAPVLPQQLKPRSALTALIAEKQSSAENPFAAEYSFHSGKGEPNPVELVVYTPRATNPTAPMNVVVKSLCSVEDVIGYALYQYVDEKREPALTEELWDINMWVLRIAEGDGEIEEDLPAVERSQKIARVRFDSFALCEATSAQIKLNEQYYAKLMKTRPKREPPPGNLPPSAVPTTTLPTTSTTTSNILPIPSTALSTLTMMASSSAQPSSTTAIAPQPLASAAAVPVPSSKSTLTKSTLTNPAYLHLRVRLMTSQEVSAITTIPVYPDMFLGDVLELVCRKRKLDPNLYMLKFPESNALVPLDSTVENWHGVQEMTLVKKAVGLTTPSSSNHIWRSPSRRSRRDDMFQPMYSVASVSNESGGYMSQYKKFIVNRKMPMFVGRRESVLAIDGDYVHIMPAENKGMFEMKTSSYHISAVESCKQSKKVPTNFKLVVLRDRDQKSYDLEADTPKETGEICTAINRLIQMNKVTK